MQLAGLHIDGYAATPRHRGETVCWTGSSIPREPKQMQAGDQQYERIDRLGHS